MNFRVEDRSGVMFVVREGKNPGDLDIVTVASAAEVELWNALTSRLAAPHRESYIRVSEQDMVEMLLERDELRRQLVEVRHANDELRGQLPAGSDPSSSVCRVCGLPATHQTIPNNRYRYCEVHVTNIRTTTERIPMTTIKESE